MPGNGPRRRSVRTPATGHEPWTWIESFTRPDGSLAESLVLGRDGTRFHSTFSGRRITHEVVLAGGQKVTLDTVDGLQSAYVGNDRMPVLQSTWTGNGPVVSLPRTRVADAGIISAPALATAAAATAAAFYALYNMQRAEPSVFGAGTSDLPVMAFAAWEYSGGRDASPTMVRTLTQEQVRQFCKRLPDVQAWTDEATRLLEADRWILGPQRFGTVVHKWIERKIKFLQSQGAYADLEAEYSVETVAPADAILGTGVTTRLDVLEDAAEGELVCVYDIKTGQRGLTPKRLKQISLSVNKHFGHTRFIVVEIRPFE